MALEYVFLESSGSLWKCCGRGGGKDSQQLNLLWCERVNGGEGGIRTHGTIASTTVFETAPFDHSGTSPHVWSGVRGAV